jgi:CRISPR-associated protein Csd1
MSWIQCLSETYDACFGQPQFMSDPVQLTPIDHIEQQAHIEIALDEDGQFLRASIVQKEGTLIPATEKSAGRTSGPVAHPLCDKLRYVAADYGSEDHALFLNELRAWAAYSGNPNLNAVLRYVERGTVVHDLLKSGILVAQAGGSLERVWANGPSVLAKLLTADAKTKERDQGNAFIRWRVELPGENESALWKHPRLQSEWAAFTATLPAIRGLCLNTGMEEPLAISHPKRLRHGGDGAKLISTNDDKNYTYRGRFIEPGEAYGLGTASTQKAHNALRWLIARQGARQGDQVVVAWAVQTATAAPVLVDSLQFILGLENGDLSNASAEDGSAYMGDAGQAFALRLRKVVRGYQAKLGDNADIVVIALDSATPGRMAILYYRELRGSEFLARLETWHSVFAWQQNFGKDRQFVGAPAPRDIAEAAFGRRVDEKLRKATVERLLPCIVDGRPLPRDLELAAVARATNRAGLERWEFERFLGIACSLVRGAHPKEKYKMSLDESRLTRDYLYGRLLAVADNLEELALRVAREERETNAARLMQRFADHPFTTWRTLELQLRPYIARLRSSRFAGALVIRQRLLDSLPSAFPAMAEGASSFTDNSRLSGEFLLGYHCQREALRPKNMKPTAAEEQNEGETSE